MSKEEGNESNCQNNNSNQSVPKMEVEDEDGVWSADIEQAFKESLQIYPPCGRRKIILSEEGKMYGRNEMIARYILLKTGKKRTRKQVSSHIQVLARRTQREKNPGMKTEPQLSSSIRDPSTAAEIIGRVPPQTYLPVTSTSSVGLKQERRSESPNENRQIYLGNNELRLHTFNVQVSQEKEISVDDSYEDKGFTHTFLSVEHDNISISEHASIRQLSDKFHATENRANGLIEMFENGPKDSFYLIKFWADLRFEEDHEMSKVYEMNTIFETVQTRNVEVTTAAYSFGDEAVSKCETVSPIDSDSCFKYELNTVLCKYGTGFIERLLALWPEKDKMDKVLEHFTVLHTLRDANTQEILLVLAMVFAVSESNNQGSTYHIYKLKP